MIDPKKVTDYGRSDAELQIFWLFCLFVAGKNADAQAKALTRFLEPYLQSGAVWASPFEWILDLEYDELLYQLSKARVGQYRRLIKAIIHSLGVDLRWCSVEQLEAIPGVGPKTARFFILHTRKDARLAVLDTHILKWLKQVSPDLSGLWEVPKSTPSKGKKYEEVERVVLWHIDQLYPTLTSAEADLLIWTTMSGRLEE